MPILTPRVNSLNLFSIKRAIESISRNAITLKNPSESGNLYVAALPDVAEWKEGDAMFADDSGTTKLVFKMKGVRHTMALIQE